MERKIPWFFEPKDISIHLKICKSDDDLIVEALKYKKNMTRAEFIRGALRIEALRLLCENDIDNPLVKEYLRDSSPVSEQVWKSDSKIPERWKPKDI